MKITPEIIEGIKGNVGALLSDHAVEIEVALCDADDALTMALPVKMLLKGSDLLIQTGINFVKTRVKDSAVFRVSDQQEMFKGE